MAATFADPVLTAFTHAAGDFKNELNNDAIYSQIIQSQTTTIDQVYVQLGQLQEEQAKRGRLRALSKIKPFLDGLRGYAATIEVFVQVKPDLLALIWGPIKLILQWADALQASFDAIVNIMADIASVLPDFQKGSQIFSGSVAVKEALVLFYRDILDLYAEAFKFFNKPGWKIAFEALWPKCRGRLKLIGENVIRHTTLVQQKVTFEHIQTEYEASQQARKHYNDTELAHQRQEYRGIKADINPSAYHDRLYRLQSEFCPGTEGWLFRSTKFRKWLDPDDANQILWLQGIPGAGKTYLAGATVGKCSSFGNVLFVFLDYRSRSRTTALSVCHSLIFQLADGQDHLQEIVSCASRESLKSSLTDAVAMLRILAASSQPLYIIVDGLDEILESERAKLARLLADLPTDDCPGLKILVSSRPEADLKWELDEVAATLQVNKKNQASIETYVSNWTANWIRQIQALPRAKQTLIQLFSAVAPKANGMFLYARLVLKNVELMGDLSQIEREMRVLPESLGEAYARILERIENLVPSAKGQVRNLLGWVAYSPVPMTAQEIHQALYIRRDDPDGRRSVVAALNVTHLCGPIVEVDNDIVQFVHFTAKEYVSTPTISGYIDPREALFSLTSACITYLCQQHQQPGLGLGALTQYAKTGTYSLQNFAADNWLTLVENLASLIPDSEVQSIGGTGTTNIPEELASLLGTLLGMRQNPQYLPRQQDAIQTPPTTAFLQVLSRRMAAVYTMLNQEAAFRTSHLAEERKIMRGSLWTQLDPLTVSQASIEIKFTLEPLLEQVESCSRSRHARPDCMCAEFRAYYGSKPFKCSMLGCPYLRIGFPSNAERNAHEKSHSRPWKCSFPNCEYAQGGFFSRRMRDDHLDRYHQNLAATETNRALPPVAKLDAVSEVYDLIAAQDEANLTLTEPVWAFLPPQEKWQLCEFAAEQGGLPVFEYVVARFKATGGQVPDWELQRLCNKALGDGNADIFRSAMGLMAYGEVGIPSGRQCAEIFFQVERTPATDAIFLDAYAQRVDASLGTARRGGMGRQFATEFLHYVAEHVQEGDLARPGIICQIWAATGMLREVSRDDLSAALFLLARRSCSAPLAEAMVDAGADVNFITKHGPIVRYLARNARKESLGMLALLIRKGADPNAGTGMPIGNMKAVQKMPELIGISWDQLLQEAAQMGLA